MNHHSHLFSIVLLLVFITACQGQKKTPPPVDSSVVLDMLPKDDPYFNGTQTITSDHGPNTITRNILQDQKGNIWLATWDGIVRYDGNSFTNFTNKDRLKRFRVFSILEDRTGKVWFGTIGAGVYRFDYATGDFINFTTHSGLVSDQVHCMYEDKKGKIWFGTAGGISCHDPVTSEFQNFTSADGLTSNDVNSIAEDPAGKIWISTRGAPCIYDGMDFTRLVNDDGTSFSNIRCIIQDQKGNMWLGGNGGLWRYADHKFTSFSKFFVGYIYEDQKGNIWTSSDIGGNWALSRYDVLPPPIGEIKDTPTTIKAEQNMFFGIEEDEQGNIWLGTLRGIYRYDGTSFDDFKQPVALNPLEQQYQNMAGTWASVEENKEMFDTLKLLKEGQYFLTTEKKKENGNWRIVDLQHLELGDVKYRFYFNQKNIVLQDEKGNKHELSKHNRGKTAEFLSIITSDTLISQFVRRIFQDKNGNLWLGTNGDGVARYDGNTLEYFSIGQGFGGVAVRAIVEDTAGNLWFGTEGGLTKFDGHSFTNYARRDGLAHSDVWCVEIDRKGTIWVGTYKGVSRFDGKTFTAFELPETAPDPNRGVTSPRIVHAIMEDSKGNMWFTTNGGAYIYDGKSLSNISEKDGLCNNMVNDILEDRHGNIWFATHYGGACFWDGKSFTRMATKERASGTEAWSLYEDSKGDIWFPIENFGVYRYNPASGTLTNFDKKDGLASGVIQCAFEDRDGKLWLGGFGGLFRLDGTSFISVTKYGPWR
ncbi:MAG: two-component regulator propeller domain-containing protein [Bacteroidota bacterium]